jgi:mannosyltransferase OCH1-like enzyme
MIPKIVLSCWFGRGEKTDLFKRCRESKEKVLKDWTFIDVNEDNCDDLMDTAYMASVHARGEFVKCTELGRLWALQKYGGVYMDEDVEVLKEFDDALLSRLFFIAREDDNWINGAVMGSIAYGHTINTLVGTFPQETEGRLGAHNYGPGFLTDRLSAMPGTPVLPPEYFYPYLWNQTPEQAVITENTYAVHHWAKSWVGKY